MKVFHTEGVELERELELELERELELELEQGWDFMRCSANYYDISFTKPRAKSRLR